MPKFCFLSHIIEQKMPQYGKAGGILLDKTVVKSMKCGDSCNINKTSLNSHIGTHIDCPAHFFINGKNASQYPADYWIFNHPYITQKDLKENEIVTEKQFFSVPPNTDIIIFKSNFQKFRKQPKYNTRNPGVSEGAAVWLRKNRPKVRMLGIDFISVSPFQNRELGRRSHKAFLNPDSRNNPVLLLEDMDLSKLGSKTKLSIIWVFPLRVKFWDSAPCTVIGKIKS